MVAWSEQCQGSDQADLCSWDQLPRQKVCIKEGLGFVKALQHVSSEESNKIQNKLCTHTSLALLDCSNASAVGLTILHLKSIIHVSASAI